MSSHEGDRVSEGPAFGLVLSRPCDVRATRRLQRELADILEPGDEVWMLAPPSPLPPLVAARAVGGSGHVWLVGGSDGVLEALRRNGFDGVRTAGEGALEDALARAPAVVVVPEEGEQRRRRLVERGYEIDAIDGCLLARRVRESMASLPEAPLVSCVIPTYNRRSRVPGAIRSALEQTYAPLEVIVVDDGSTDGTADALERDFGDRIRVLRKENGGVSSARNHGVAHAEGELVAFLDSDDAWMPDKVARQVDYFLDHDRCALVLTGFLNVDDRGEQVVSRRDALPEDGAILHHVLRDPILLPSTMMVRRDVYVAARGFDESLPTAEDLDLHLRIARRHHEALLPDPLVRYDAGSGDRLSELARSYEDDVVVIERFVGLHHHEIPARDRDAALFRAYLRVARGMIFHRDYASAARFAVKMARVISHTSDVRELGALGWLAFRHGGVRLRRALRRT
jgi:glycosyltransferase involved in cell wall biosynthesis